MNYDNISEKNKYIDLKNYLSLIVAELNTSLEELEMSSKLIKDNFTIDNYSKAKHKIEEKIGTITKMKSDLQQIVIPQIENIISSYNVM